ncbi:NAD(P)H-dependent oxidoreductase [Qipengyuania sp. JC766]|uniref:FMN-dependent NADH-azoreductase n=1 Tax=Qipengyuania sp. JC766 TaxID=3232139 RepID=UPI003459894D
MTNILHIKASIRGNESVSNDLGNRILETLRKEGETAVVTRDLSANDLPFIDQNRFAANLAPYAERDDAQHDLAKIADTLIEELQAADVIVFSTPIYNFTMPSTVKAWADLVARAGTTFRYTANGPEGLLTGKKAYLAIASGGTPVEGAVDFMTPWLKFFLGFLGITDVVYVAADGIMGEGGELKIEDAREEALRLAA